MKNFTEMGYETITVIRSEYPPIIGKCLSISPVLWIQSIEKENSVDKEEKRFFVFSRNNCIKEIYELSQSLNDYIDGIITPCGTILPIDNKIEFLTSEGIDIECIDGKIRFFIKAPLNPSLGGTGFITYNEGDILVGNKDGKLSILLKGKIGQALGIKEDGTVGYIDVLTKLTCESSQTVTENALVRWSADGKCLKNGIAIEDDKGNITQENDLHSESLRHTIHNKSLEPNSHSQLELRTNGENAGNPYIHWSVTGKRDFVAGIDNADNDSWKICRNFILNNDPVFRINSDGNTTHPYQYSSFAILSENSEAIGSGLTYYLGQGTPLTIIDNEGGNFFPGAGNDPSRPAMFTCKEKAKFLVYVSAVVNQNDERTNCEIQAAFSVQTKSGTTRNTGAINVIPKAFQKNTATVLGGVKAEAGDIIKFYIYTISPDTTWFIERTIGVTYTTYVGVYCLG